MKKHLLFLFLLANSVLFSQSKKEQILLLTNRVDSLYQVLSSERIDNAKKVNELNSTIINLQTQLTSLNSSPNNISTSQGAKTENYKSVKIGTQTWMAENLNVSSFRNGDPIPEVKTNEEWEKAGENKQPAWCYYDNDPKNGTKYGKLYNWYAVNDPRGLAPAGWHVPTDAEWTTLDDYLGGEEVAGKKMKSTTGWEDYEGKSGNGTNSSGFSGLPGGYRYDDGGFGNLGNGGYWWSSTEYDTYYPYFRSLSLSFGNLGGGLYDEDLGFSVRCVKD